MVQSLASEPAFNKPHELSAEPVFPAQHCPAGKAHCPAPTIACWQCRLEKRGLQAGTAWLESFEAGSSANSEYRPAAAAVTASQSAQAGSADEAPAWL